MNASSIPPSAAANSNSRTFSLAGYREHNDRLEAKYPEVARARAAVRGMAMLRDAREHLRRARRCSRSIELRVDALEGAVEAVLLVSEMRTAR